MMRHCLRLTVGFVGLSLFFWMILLVQKGVFLCFNFHALRASGSHAIADSLWRGLRFEGAALALLLSPALLLFWAAAATGWLAMRRLLFVYGVGLSLVISLITLADLQYFAETDSLFSGWMSELDSAAVVVRPDRYVFGAASDAEQLNRIIASVGRHVLGS